MVILLPKAKDGLAQLESSLTSAKLESWLSKLSSHRVDVSLPKFKLTAECELKDALSELGMPVGFQAGRGGFLGNHGHARVGDFGRRAQGVRRGRRERNGGRGSHGGRVCPNRGGRYSLPWSFGPTTRSSS